MTSQKVPASHVWHKVDFQTAYKDARTLEDASQAIEILSPSEREELRTALQCIEAYFGKDAVSARLNVYSTLLEPSRWRDLARECNQSP